MVKNGTLYYVHTDNLGSIQAITDENKNIVSSYYYTPWGGRVLLSGANITDRGYTFHEHLEAFGLINMNGRVYDPLTAQFFSPDPVLQAPGDWLNYNRYGYCMGNPFKYTDPTGEVFVVDDAIIILVMAYFGGMQANFFTAKNPMNPADWNWSSPSTYIGIGSGVLAGVSMAGYQVPTLFPNLDGIVTRGVYQAGVNVGLNGIANTINGDSFFDSWGGAALSGFINGAITGYQLADVNGKNLWWGSEIGYNRNKWSFFNWDVPDYLIDFGMPNVGSNLDNDCVPTTFAEIEAKRGGSRTYDDFKGISNYQENVGVATTQKGYETLVNKTFSNAQTLSRTDYHNLFDANYMQNAANNNEVFSVHFRGHADNVRSLRVFTRAPYKNTLTFRQGSYNFTSSGQGVVIWNIFRFF